MGLSIFCSLTIGVAGIIKYYKNSDVVKTRIEQMTFLMVEIKGIAKKEYWKNHRRS